MKADPDRAGKTSTRFLAMFLPTALALCLVFYLFFRQQSVYEIRMLQRGQMNYLLQEKQRMETIIEGIVSDTLLLAQSDLTRELAENPQGPIVQALGRFFLVVVRNKPDYARLRFLDPKGRELVRIERSGAEIILVPQEQLQDKSSRYYVREGLALGPGQVFVSRFDLNVEQGKLEQPLKPMLRFVAAVRDRAGQVRGLLIVNYLGEDILPNLVTAKLKHGRLEMVDQEGYWLRGPRAEDEWGFMMPERSLIRMDLKQPELWRQIKGKREGQLSAPQGMISFVLVRPPENTVGQHGWYVISHIPQTELSQAIDPRSGWIMLASLLAAGAVFCWRLALGQTRHRLIQARVRKDAENQGALKSLLSLRLEDQPLETTMESALDIVLSVSWLSTLHMGGVFLAEHDGQAPVLRLVAERNLDPQTRTICSTVAWGHCLCGQAASSGQLQYTGHVDSGHLNQFGCMADHGHYNIPLMTGPHCEGVLVLYLPKGKGALEEEMSFLKTVGNALAGIVDSHEKELAIRNSEARLSALVNTAVEGIVTIDQAGTVLSFNHAAEKIFGYQASEIIGHPVNLLQPDDLAVRHDEYIKHYLETGEAKVIGIGREVTGRRKDGSLFPLYLSVGEVRQGGRVMFTGILRDISELKEAQERLEQANRQLMNKQRMLDQDLAAAAGIQQALLPTDFPHLAGWEMAWRFTPSQHIGGDILNISRLSPDHVCFYMLDVSGHGVPAALVTVSVHEMLRTSSGHVVQYLDDGTTSVTEPRWVADLLDQEYPLDRFDKYFTLFYSVLNVRTGVLVYTNAGHPAPLVVRPDGATASLEVGGTVIGMGQSGGFSQAEYQLRPGDRLFLYTDGLMEHESPHGEQFGPDRLQEALVRNNSQGLDQWIQTVLNEVLAFGPHKPPDDDISILAAEYKGD